MEKNKMKEEMKNDISRRSELMVKGAESELENIQKYIEALKNTDPKDTDKILNNARALCSYANSLSDRVAGEFKNMDEIRIGLYYLNCAE